MQRKTGNSTLISVWPSAYIVDQALAYVRIRCVHNTIQAGNNAAAAAAGTTASVIVARQSASLSQSGAENCSANEGAHSIVIPYALGRWALF